MLVVPSALVEVSSVSPAIRPNWRSSGVATEDAIVSGLAPGRLPLTWMVGKSTSGNGATGSIRNAAAPASAIATVNSVVATGLRMKISEKLMRSARGTARGRRCHPARLAVRAARRSKARKITGVVYSVSS